MAQKKTKLIHQKFKRLVYINEQIKAKRYPNCITLSKELNCSEMTIHRDKDYLMDMFLAPIEYSRVEKGYYYTDDNFELPLLQTIGEEELEILASAKILLSHYKNTPLYEKAENLINILSSCGKNNNKMTSLLNRIAVAPVPFVKVDSKSWNLIKIAMEESRVLEFTYKNSDWDSDLEIRTVRPYQFLFDDGKVFLFGYLEEKEDVRLFKIEKMDKLKILAKHFELPKDYEFEKFCGGGNFGAFRRNNAKKYKIAFYEDVRDAIRNGYWADDQEFEEDDENDCTIVTFTSSQDMRVLDWIFKNKAYAIPLEPPELVKRWKYNVKVMAEIAGIVEPNGITFWDIFPEERPVDLESPE